MSLRHLLGTIVLTASFMSGFSGLAIAGEEAGEAPESSISEETQPPAAASPTDEATDEAKDEAAEEGEGAEE
jgi:hypothetical protein